MIGADIAQQTLFLLNLGPDKSGPFSWPPPLAAAARFLLPSAGRVTGLLATASFPFLARVPVGPLPVIARRFSQSQRHYRSARSRPGASRLWGLGAWG
jgi:hypothetical protein